MKAFPGLILMAACCLPCVVQARSQQISDADLGAITRRTWLMRNGLPDHLIHSLVTTPDHYLWLGTPWSLIRFDGFHFTDAGGSAAPLIHDFGISSLYAARDGSLWAGTGGGHVLHFANGSVEAFGVQNGLNGFAVRALAQDESGTLWVGADHGVFRFVHGRFQRVNQAGNFKDPSVRAMVPDGAGGLWIGGHLLFHYANGVIASIALPRQIVSTRITALALSPDGTLWIGTSAGLLRKEKDKAVAPTPVLAKGIDSLLTDRGGKLWAGTTNAGIFFRRADGRFAHFAEATEGISETVLALTSDERGDIWVGSHSGLERLSDTGVHLVPVPAVRNSEFASVALDRDGSLWVAAGKVLRLSGGRIQAPRLPMVDDAPVRAILRDREGSLWVATSGGGAIRIPVSGPPQRHGPTIGTSYITGFLQGKDNDVWIATESGVALWRQSAIVSFQRAPGAPHQSVTSMALAGPDDLWIGTNHGLSHLYQGQFVIDPQIDRFGAHTIRALFGRMDGTVWIGTEAGLFRLKNGRIRQVPLELGGENPAVQSIFDDGYGRLWIGSRHAVHRLERAAVDRVLDVNSGGGADIAVETFPVSRETGAELYGGQQSSAVSDGGVGAWFVSDDGPVHIDGARRQNQENVPPVVLEQIVVDGRSLEPSGTITLAPNVRTLEIGATPVLLSSQTGLQIRRKLIGFDKDWSMLPSSHLATYTNLPPGEYRYRVEAFWPGRPDKSAVELRIVRQAHFYTRIWFLALCLAALLLMAWGLYRLRLQQMAARFAAVAEERNRVARELHDTLLQGCIGVQFLLDGIDSSVQVDGKPKEFRWMRSFTLARKEIERTIREAREAIWNLRQSENETHLDRAVRELVEKGAKSAGIAVTFKTSGPSLPITADRRSQMLLAVREAVQNAIRHAQPQSLTASVMSAGNKVTVEIADQGIGMVPVPDGDGGLRHFGIVGMKERMKNLGGRCTIRSQPGEGTTVTLEMPVYLSSALGAEDS